MKELLVEVELVAEMAVYNPFDFFLEDSATYFPFAYEETLRKDVAAFMEKSRLTPKFEAYLAAARREILGHPELLAHASRFDSLHRTDVHHEGGQIPAFGSSPQNAAEDSASHNLLTAVAGKAEPIRTIDFLVALNQRIQRDIKYLIRLEAGVQSAEETLTKLSGSCRDSRLVALPVAAPFWFGGAFCQRLPDSTQARCEIARWSERRGVRISPICMPGAKCICRAAGWIGLDPTSGLLAGEGHIPLGCTPEPRAPRQSPAR